MTTRTRLALGACLIATSAFAQVPEFQLERFRLNDGAGGSLATPSGEVMGQGDYRVSAALHYQNSPLTLLRDGAKVGAVVEHRLGVHVGFTFGILEWLQASAEVPVVLTQMGDDLSSLGVASPRGTALGSPWLSARAQLLSQEKGGVAMTMAPVDLAFQLGLALPLGTLHAMSREAGLAVVPQVSVGRALDSVRLGASLGAVLRTDVVTLSQHTVARDTVGHQLELGAMIAGRGEGLRLEADLHLLLPLGGENTPSGGELLVGLRAPIGPTEVFLLGGPGFGSLPGMPAFRVLAGAAFPEAGQNRCRVGREHTPEQCPALDDDADTILNALDKCPLAAEDKDGFEDLDGCPDLDNDTDGVPDQADLCPVEKGVAAKKGCPVRDADQDGVEDDQDSCPREAGPADHHGCPVRDADKDGVEDPQDTCPNEAGPADHQGCPVRDADKDGVEDAQDKCPNEAGPADRQGCPAPDGDQDGVEDSLDKCPKEKGDKANGGCPAGKNQLVELTREKLVIKATVDFALGKATILPRSFKLLDQVADVLKGHPEVTVVNVEGHTDDQGPRPLNVKLSQARADSVKGYLVKKGVQAKRLAARGFGPDRPLVPNTDDASRAQNRRVDFVLETAEKVQQKTSTTP